MSATHIESIYQYYWLSFVLADGDGKGKGGHRWTAHGTHSPKLFIQQQNVRVCDTDTPCVCDRQKVFHFLCFRILFGIAISFAASLLFVVVNVIYFRLFASHFNVAYSNGIHKRKVHKPDTGKQTKRTHTTAAPPAATEHNAQCPILRIH